jgi:predicted RNA-binding protein with PIN domain
MSSHFLVVDGHSVIYAWPDLRSLHARKPVAARDELIQLLSRVHDVGRWRITLVFDGVKGTAEKRRPHDMVVHYSIQGQTADAVIERLVAGSSCAEKIVVVTADEAEKRTVEALGASTAAPDWLELECRAQEDDLSRRLKSVSKSARWND